MKNKILVSSLAGLFIVAIPVSAATAPESSAASKPKVAYIQGMDKEPSIVKRVAPTYPTALRERGIQGYATVEMVIDSTGRVTAAEAVRSTRPAFAKMAVQAAKQWHFSPAEADGKKITSRVQIPFEFVMPEIAAMESRQR